MAMEPTRPSPQPAGVAPAQPYPNYSAGDRMAAGGW
jgi:hypothetical protein